jgi:hypothetical protein
VALPARVQRSDSWSARMREQYGLDTSAFSYEPEGRRGGGGGGAPLITRRRQRSGWCAVM